MSLTERQDKERRALIGEIIECADLSGLTHLKELCDALKQVTTDPETYFKILDKEE